MAVIISYVQFRLERLQTALAQAKSMPAFVLWTEQTYNPATHYFEGENLSVENNGGPAYDIDPDYRVFVVIRFVGAQHGTEEIPVYNFYEIGEVGSRTSGHIITWIGRSANANFVKLTDEFGRLIKKKPWYAEIEMARYVRLKYEDVLGNYHTQYYFVKVFGGAKALTLEEGSRWFAEYDTKQASGRYPKDNFNELTGDDLVKLAEQRLR